MRYEKLGLFWKFFTKKLSRTVFFCLENNKRAQRNKRHIQVKIEKMMAECMRIKTRIYNLLYKITGLCQKLIQNIQKKLKIIKVKISQNFIFKKAFLAEKIVIFGKSFLRLTVF